MSRLSLDESFRILEIPNGSQMKTVNEAWKLLSQIYHPDRYQSGSKVYEHALKKQKALNTARDVIKDWYKQHPGQVPPAPSSSRGPGHNPRPDTSKPKQQKKSSAKSTGTYRGAYSKWQEFSKGQTQSKAKKQKQPTIKVPPHIKNFRDSFFSYVEERNSAEKVNRKIAFQVVACSSPYSILLAMSLLIFGPIPPGFIVFITFFAGLTGAIFVYYLYLVERTIWQAENSTFTRVSKKTAFDLFEDCCDSIRQINEPTFWQVQNKVIDHDNNVFQIHFLAEPLIRDSIYQQINLYLTVKPTSQGSKLTVDYRIKAPGHRFKIHRMIQDVNSVIKSLTKTS